MPVLLSRWYITDPESLNESLFTDDQSLFYINKDNLQFHNSLKPVCQEYDMTINNEKKKKKSSDYKTKSHTKLFL